VKITEKSSFSYCDAGELTSLLDDNSDDEIKQQRKLVSFFAFYWILNVSIVFFQ